ncbi:MAG: hypothetical protein OXU61_07570, partial [Gammaproteobacteria bacterium]|nr:hypothetical protein [Gammaproteobacteria bacterium]
AWLLRLPLKGGVMGKMRRGQESTLHGGVGIFSPRLRNGWREPPIMRRKSGRLRQTTPEARNPIPWSPGGLAYTSGRQRQQACRNSYSRHSHRKAAPPQWSQPAATGCRPRLIRWPSDNKPAPAPPGKGVYCQPAQPR